MMYQHFLNIFKYDFVSLLDISTLTLMTPPNGCYGLGKYLLIFI